MNQFWTAALVGVGVIWLMKKIDDSQVAASSARALARYRAGERAGYPDLLAPTPGGWPNLLVNGSARPPAGATWDPAQAGWVTPTYYTAGEMSDVYL